MAKIPGRSDKNSRHNKLSKFGAPLAGGRPSGQESTASSPMLSNRNHFRQRSLVINEMRTLTSLDSHDKHDKQLFYRNNSLREKKNQNSFMVKRVRRSSN